MFRRYRLLVAAALVVLAVTLGLLIRQRHLARNAEPRVAATDADRAAEAVVLTSHTPEAPAAPATPHAENARTFYNLPWFFGGKPQRGWHLYAPLISELIGTGEPPTSLAFAASLAKWQGGNDLAPTGVVDEETLMRMVSAWQSCRSKDRTYPQPEQLVTVSGGEFYDTARVAELRRVERDTYAAYRRMLRAAADDPALGLKMTPGGDLDAAENRLRIISAFRSREYQARLRKESPHSGRAGLAVNSPHFTGRALDLYIAGEPVETKDANRTQQVNTSVYRWLVRNAGRFGFRPYFYEPWHWEYDPALDPMRAPSTAGYAAGEGSGG